jgi:hypothetical protein
MSMRIKTMPQTMTTMVMSSGENTSIAVALLHTRCEMESYYSLLLSLTAGTQKITVTPIGQKFKVRVTVRPSHVENHPAFQPLK